MGIAEGNTVETNAKYKIIQKLGEGNYGTVFLAKQQEVDRHVAMKVLLGDQKKFQQLQGEAWVQGKLCHPNIVPVYDLTVANRQRCLIMEYVRNSLQKVLEEYFTVNKLPPLAFGLKIIEGSMEALAHAHYVGVVHGDIKPGNILINENGEPKLSDFGVARLFWTGAKGNQGSAGWAAPEVLNIWNERGIWACDYQSDLFSIGVVAYILLTGRHPYVHPGGVLPVEKAVLRDDFAPLPPKREGETIPENYAAVIMKLIQRNRTQRYASAQDALIDLQEGAVIQCVNCGGENTAGVLFCNWCGTRLQQEPKEVPLVDKRPLVEARELFGTGQIAKGLSVLKTFLGNEEVDAKRWSLIGYRYNAEGWYKDADIVCTQAIGLDPNLTAAYQTRGFARSNLGQFRDAITDFNKALELAGPDDVQKRCQILYQRGYAYMRLNRKLEACRDASESLKLSPGYGRAKWLVSVVCKKEEG